MKRTFTIALLLMLMAAMHAQKDVTKFLGIPVDGTKSAMIQKLKAKGFTTDPYTKDVLKGQFNGMDVNVHIATNNNKVCRIMVCDAKTVNETDIKIRFNILCRQFSNNPKYIPASFEDYTISDDEDISYEMSVNNKRYEAVYYQTAQKDSAIIARETQEFLSTKYSEEQLANPTDELREEMLKAALSHFLDSCSQKSVWFMISDYYGKYYITMFYDNEYNRANGEDL